MPRRAEETEFWRLYFSQVLYVLDCVKEHGCYPPPAAKPAADAAFSRGAARKSTLDGVPPPEEEESLCSIS